jgi:hypothetical protein
VRAAVHAILLGGLLLFTMGAGGDADGSSALAIIREFGFPVFVALWFMWRVEKRMDRFTEVVQNLLTTVTIMAKTIDELPDARPQRAPTNPSEAA